VFRGLYPGAVLPQFGVVISPKILPQIQFFSVYDKLTPIHRTLQELLAPTQLIFFDQNWIKIGTKSSLISVISRLTGIDHEHLESFEKASIAQKLSWASRRETLRIEDQSYCLLGLVGINMSLLYGEGERAFLRLQTEIVNSSTDETIFAWRGQSDLLHGLLASSPSDFRNSGNIIRLPSRRLYPYSMTNKGLQISLSLNDLHYENELRNGHWAPFYCIEKGATKPLALCFRKVKGQSNTWVRIHCSLFAPEAKRSPGRQWKEQKMIYVVQEQSFRCCHASC
jgi:hypothetical protein